MGRRSGHIKCIISLPRLFSAVLRQSQKVHVLGYCCANFQGQWIFQVLPVFTLIKRKFALNWRFWWNWVSERVLKCFFREKKFGKFSTIFRPNFLPKSYRAAIGPPWVQNVPDGCKTDISVPYVCTYGVRFFYEFILLRKENILDTQIMKKFHV